MALQILPPLLFLLLLLLSLASFEVTSSNTLSLNEVCKKTLYPDLCHSTLASAGETSDMNSLAAITIKAGSDSATETQTKISEFLNATTDPFVQQCLSDCSENYMDVLDQLNDSLSALDKGSYADASTWVTAAMSDIQTCQSGFEDKEGYESPLEQRNGDFLKLCSISLSIVNLLS